MTERHDEFSKMELTFVVRPGIPVRPIHKLLVYPRQETDGRIGQAMSYRLGLRRLLYHVPATFMKMTLRLRKCLLRLPVERVCKHIKQHARLRKERRDSNVGSLMGAYDKEIRCTSR